ncbi:hypothetical protein QN277_012344 [Acacia crassicarpa]|uniref:Wall-associated receptor kinase galacturonan-binding domain-containing protein n=1 Tax=Acacia crassicarpa TaxID=499986 RepID=A0AAE1N100_9FABA|nr:hypothetical protein QN277_012344 [Acacia crassicarpa]
MGPPSVLPHQLVFFNTFFFFILWLAPHFAIADEQFSACEPFNCGNITNLSYPFWSNSRPQFCGHPRFKLDCEGDNVTINMASKNFHVIDAHSNARTLTIARMDLWGTKCPREFQNITLDYPFFNYTSNDVNSTILYDCDPSESMPNPVNLSSATIFNCPINSNPRQAYFSLVGDRWFNKTALGCRIWITSCSWGGSGKILKGCHRSC